jgi:hypothetical protein
MKNNLMYTPEKREDYNAQIHSIGRIFTWVALAVIVMVPIAYAIAAGDTPDWALLASCLPFIAGYWAIGLIEAISYAPLLGTGGQYLSFITGNISNLKLPCAINAQNVLKVEPGSEKQEIITTISIAISSIVTTLIIIVGLIPLLIFQNEIVSILKPISPYVMPSIFGGLTMVVIAKYYKIAIIPFLGCIIVCIIGFSLGMGKSLSVATMIIIGMVISGISTTIMYTLKKKKLLKASNSMPTATSPTEQSSNESEQEKKE